MRPAPPPPLTHWSLMTPAPARVSCSFCSAAASSSCWCSSCAWPGRPGWPEKPPPCPPPEGEGNLTPGHQEREFLFVDLFDLRLGTDRRLGNGTQRRQRAPHLAHVALGVVEGVLDHG